MTALVVTLMAGAGVLAGSKSYTDAKLQKVMQNSQQVAGKAAIGGEFKLVDHNGRAFTDRQAVCQLPEPEDLSILFLIQLPFRYLLGEFALLYFGFTFCPDICPEELEKIASAVDLVEAQVRGGARSRIVLEHTPHMRSTLH